VSRLPRSACRARHAGRRPPSSRSAPFARPAGCCGAAGPAGGGLAWANPAGPVLGYTEALELARQTAPALRAQQATLAGSTALVQAASALPDPRLSVGVENLPISRAGPLEHCRATACTMQRIALMQEMPNQGQA
jgi:cobalt-zinc-cadmium efflux system outer membrane protein